MVQLGDPAKALTLYQRAVELARRVNDPFAIKLALEYLGRAYLSLRDPARALGLLNEAAILAHAMGDRKHEAKLLWYAAIAEADQGRRDPAIAHGRAAVRLMEQAGSPETTSYAEHLQAYETNRNAAGLAPGGPGHPQQPPMPTGDPGWLRMAFSAAKAAARFVASGGRTVAAELRLQRLETCASCPHHTGVRRRLCGCFTRTKSLLPHEVCPIGKWPA